MAKRRLSIKQQAFVAAIANPASPTYSNGTRSILATHPGVSSLGSAAVSASRYLTSDKIRSAIDDILRQQGLGIEVRTAKIRSILDVDTYEIEQIDRKGRVKSATRLPNHKIQLQAIHLLNKLDGSYARAEGIGHAQARVLEPLIEEYTRRLRAELRAEAASEGAVAGQGEILEGQVVSSPQTEQASAGEPQSRAGSAAQADQVDAETSLEVVDKSRQDGTQPQAEGQCGAR